tara:strand:+ start:128 stop:1018 length:891 start_codon:yes stop_codon:yes gene_type:complete
MTISRQNLSIIIVTFKSENVIHKCIKSIPQEVQIIIVDNSNDKIFKENIEKAYQNVKCLLAPKNLGMGAGNNLGLKYIKTDYAFILNPDVVLYSNTIDEIINSQNNLESFIMMAPISDQEKYPNYKINKNQNINLENNKPFLVNSVDGYAMLLNLKRLSKYEEFNNFNYFDENFFMYLENEDLCRRIKNKNENIYVIPKSKINHLGGKAVDIKFNYEIEMSRNWHWIWSKFYFNKKHFGYFNALKDGLPSFLSALIKFLFFFFINKKKRDTYLYRALGYLNALAGKSSYYRPKINN